MTDDQFQELKRLLGGNREAIEGNREAIEDNREAIEGNRQAIGTTSGRLNQHISAVDERFEKFEAKLAEEGRRTRSELTGRIDAVESRVEAVDSRVEAVASRLEAKIETTVDEAFQKLMGLTASMFEHQTGQFQRLFELTGSMFEHQTGEFRKLEARLDAVLGEETRG